MKRILIFIFFIHLFLVETAKALDCRDTELLTDIAACKDQDIRHNLAKISEYENSFIKAHEQCKTQSCLRELYRKKAEIAEVMKGLLKPSEKLTDRLPDRAGIRQLVGEGKLLPLNKTLKEKFLKSDLWFFPYQSHNPEHEKKGVVKPFHLRYSDCSRGVMDYSCMSFLMTEQIDSLPEGLGGAVAIELYIPKDLVAPENPGHSEFYYLPATILTQFRRQGSVQHSVVFLQTIKLGWNICRTGNISRNIKKNHCRKGASFQIFPKLRRYMQSKHAAQGFWRNLR